MRKFIAAAAIGLTCAIAVSVSALLIRAEPAPRFFQPGPTGSTTSSGLSAKQIQLAVRVGQDAAAPGPGPSRWSSNVVQAEAVLSDRSTATIKLMHGDETGGGFRRVIVIRMSGTFPWNISHPPGWRPPTPNANSVILVIDARTGEPLDSSLGNNVPQLDALGDVVILYQRSSEPTGRIGVLVRPSLVEPR